ncbi:uncharacterized protein B0H18DRAFT_937620 [Fomitopsis serialis]|uniref:uncharacterized protein n=1 Tax=Fomitopsis serialis TaxID=139415 RepID=UPI002007DC4C|nr:uncharacterized protein B0H18DRAFT_937620 [Neoantrodia serialis]KAH9918850.1 hypothetical protein B0H18DRAFT_937620 [Neoantrodia serialis]
MGRHLPVQDPGRIATCCTLWVAAALTVISSRLCLGCLRNDCVVISSLLCQRANFIDRQSPFFELIRTRDRDSSSTHIT